MLYECVLNFTRFSKKNEEKLSWDVFEEDTDRVEESNADFWSRVLFVAKLIFVILLLVCVLCSAVVAKLTMLILVSNIAPPINMRAVPTTVNEQLPTVATVPIHIVKRQVGVTDPSTNVNVFRTNVTETSINVTEAPTNVTEAPTNVTEPPPNMTTPQTDVTMLDSFTLKTASGMLEYDLRG